MSKKLIPKHLTPANPLILQNDNTIVSQPVLSVPITNSIDWVGAANNEIDKIIQDQPHSEIVRYPKRPKSEKEAMTIMFDPRKAPLTSSTQVIGMSPVDPIGEFVVGNAVLGKPLQWLGKGLLYGAAKAGNNWARAKIITSNMKVSPYKFNRGYYTIGHDLDPGAFYHYERNILPKTTPKTVTFEPRNSNRNLFKDNYGREVTPTSKSIITNPQSGTTLYTPDELIKSGDFAKGKEMVVKFFEHPVVQNSYKHNQELAKRFGITIPDKQAAEVVKQPVLVNYRKLNGNEIAQVSRRYYGDPDTEITMDWNYYPIKDLRQAIIHENLHRGWYSAPLRSQSMTQSYYNNTYKPEYKFWEWKTKKLLDPKYHNDWYLMDIHSGEAGPNFIDLGRDLGLKLGQKYPGYETVKQMLQNYKGNKSFIIPKLNYSKAGIRHVWDAMTGKYFTIPAAVGVSGATITNNYE